MRASCAASPIKRLPPSQTHQPSPDAQSPACNSCTMPAIYESRLLGSPDASKPALQAPSPPTRQRFSTLPFKADHLAAAKVAYTRNAKRDLTPSPSHIHLVRAALLHRGYLPSYPPSYPPATCAYTLAGQVWALHRLLPERGKHAHGMRSWSKSSLFNSTKNFRSPG